VADASGYVDELYDGIACPGGYPYYGCDPTTGTPIAVTVPLTTAGVDFALDRLGVVTGVVTETATGDPIPYTYVEVYDPETGNYSGGYTDETGAYAIGGLLDGDYVAHTETYDHVNEVFDDIPCPGYSWTCDLSAGTPIAVALDAIVSGVDFALDRFGAISGTITHALTSDPVISAEVRIFNSDGNSVDWSYTSSTGVYVFNRLPAGTYFVATDIDGNFVDELYDGLACPEGPGSGCDPTTGTPVAVALNTTTTGIDFSLDPGGAITGTVRDAASGDPLAYAPVRVWDADGALVRSWSADSFGQYSVAGLADGTYFVTSSKSGYSQQLFDGLPCAGDCDRTAGTPVAVTHNATTPGVDFTLAPLGAIAGTITDTAGAPIYDAEIRVWNATGASIGYAYVYSGSYQFTGLAPDTYFVTAYSYEGHIAEVYDDLPCPNGCDATKGTPVVVAGGATTQVDFELGDYAIAGTVTDAATGAPLAGVTIQFWDDDSYYYYYYPDWSTTTDSDGKYRRILPPGAYYVSTDNTLGLVDEVYAGRLCIAESGYYGGCDPAVGTAVHVGVSGHGPLAAGIDFALDDGVAVFSDGFETGNVSAWSSSVGTP
jgi:protocatechuate 3,4-dioxygenase beta subunit